MIQIMGFLNFRKQIGVSFDRQIVIGDVRTVPAAGNAVEDIPPVYPAAFLKADQAFTGIDDADAVSFRRLSA